VKGLFYGGGMAQLTAQAIGSASVTVATLAAATVLMYAVKMTGTLRVSTEGELEGLDLHEHGMLAYPEFPVHASPRLTPVAVQHLSTTNAPVQAPARSTT
jgi:Amt family ammonium transporter